eukprot:TRINITY_DN67131_c6_g5_i3.p1 TRINITY_DN67131_c6_g5~~TRINITY_DN67131_c6_g5_i3.p1  ORF type:complete len:139 (+),score=16.60 TRINITY_DN67131_c6_g5_i3:109-525(+)
MHKLTMPTTLLSRTLTLNIAANKKHCDDEVAKVKETADSNTTSGRKFASDLATVSNELHTSNSLTVLETLNKFRDDFNERCDQELPCKMSSAIREIIPENWRMVVGKMIQDALGSRPQVSHDEQQRLDWWYVAYMERF